MSKYVRKSKKVFAVADTGANACFAPVTMAKKLGMKMFNTFQSSLSLFTADRRKLDIKGYIPVITAARDGEHFGVT